MKQPLQININAQLNKSKNDHIEPGRFMMPC